jgi:hypothetical protein
MEVPEMKNSRFLLLLMMIIPWFSLPFLGKKTIKRFLPAAIFTSFIVKLENIIAFRRRWWGFYTQVHPKVKGDMSFILGPYLFTTFWIMRWTYGKFFLYLVVNTIMHFIFAYPVVNMLKRFGIVSFVRINPLQYVSILFSRALLLYGFQYIKEKYPIVKYIKQRFQKKKEEEKTM